MASSSMEPAVGTGHVEQGPGPGVAVSCEGQLSPRLRNALEGLDSNVQDLMVREGITTHVVIANNWESPQELVADSGRSPHART